MKNLKQTEIKQKEITVKACIVGGGPAGIMTGLLLARSGVEVVVLEKHKDFFRDFRGDTVHPSTLEVLHELGLLEKFLRLPHQELKYLKIQFGKKSMTVCDFSHLPVHCPFMAIMPQWDFLNLLTEEAKKYRKFKLIMNANVTELITSQNSEKTQVIGVRAIVSKGNTKEKLKIHADLVIAADGRHSALRSQAHLPVRDGGASIDVLWMRISRKRSDPDQSLMHFDRGLGLAMINRETYYQCGLLIKKGLAPHLKKIGIRSFRQKIAQITPILQDRVGELKTWEDIQLLNVSINRLIQWWIPGFLCIGDAAHAMGPQGGVGINLAIQDAVATANLLAGPLRSGQLNSEHLKAVQKRREFPAQFYQSLQQMIQKQVIDKALATNGQPQVGWPFYLLNQFPFLQRIPARIIGLGARPEIPNVGQSVRKL